MSDISKIYTPWPELEYDDPFKPTSHLLHMLTQMIGKLKLLTPFEPHWGNVGLGITSRGLTTGPIPYDAGVFSVSIDLINHQIISSTSWGHSGVFSLLSMSVADAFQTLFIILKSLGVDVKINPEPQEIPDPISFDQDTTLRDYNPALANAWFRALVSSYRVLQRHHARFLGESPEVGFMWGTFDLRDARYNGIPVNPEGINAGYLRRNAMDMEQVEAGWWSGNALYPHPAYYAFIYPQPAGIEQVKIKPDYARWEKNLGLFILDYNDVRQSKNPERDVLEFFESTYEVATNLSNWDPKFITSGKPF